MPTTILSAYYKHKQGGFTTRLYRAYQALDAAGYQVIYVATEPLPVTGKHIQAVIVPMRSKPSSPLYWVEFCLRSIWQLRHLTRHYQARQHLMFSFFYACLSIIAGWGLGVKTLTLVRGDDVFDAAKKRFATIRVALHRVLEKFAVRYSAQVLTTSSSMQSIISQRTNGSAKMQVLPNDIATRLLPEHLPCIKTETIRLVTVSVLTPRKNQLFLLKALSEIKHATWEYLLVGSDTSGIGYQAQLQAFAQTHGIADRVKFMGWQDNITPILQTCHLFVFPTLHEGSPNALLEAMGYGLPCLASDIPELQEVLPDHELRFTPDNQEALVAKLNNFMTLPGYARVIREKTLACRARFRFDWEQRLVDAVRSLSTQP